MIGQSCIRYFWNWLAKFLKVIRILPSVTHLCCYNSSINTHQEMVRMRITNPYQILRTVSKHLKNNFGKVHSNWWKKIHCFKWKELFLSPKNHIRSIVFFFNKYILLWFKYPWSQTDCGEVTFFLVFRGRMQRKRDPQSSPLSCWLSSINT